MPGVYVGVKRETIGPRLRQLLLATLIICPFYGRWGGAVKEEPDWDRDEIIVCMVVAFCMGNALITVIYRLFA